MQYVAIYTRRTFEVFLLEHKSTESTLRIQMQHKWMGKRNFIYRHKGKPGVSVR